MEVSVTPSRTITELLPALRRYARALTGSQASGDAYVAATLEALIEDPSVIGDAIRPKVAAFKVFTRIWNSLDVNAKEPAGARPNPADRHLGNITPRPRQAFLLIAMEGFAEAEAADILGIGVSELRRLVDESGSQLAAEIATDILIIEDEPMIAMDLESLVEGLGHKVVGIARTHREAVALAGERRPGLILADIRLADMSSGLDAVNEILQSFQVPVIFITAYPEQFLTGERPEPTFLITKPFPPAMVSAVVSQALFFDQKARRRAEPDPAAAR
jgi:CheY-like chemotaxis protein/DNA-directed RNA polymerase specialized sigma24 family protein